MPDISTAPITWCHQLREHTVSDDDEDDDDGDGDGDDDDDDDDADDGNDRDDGTMCGTAINVCISNFQMNWHAPIYAQPCHEGRYETFNFLLLMQFGKKWN